MAEKAKAIGITKANVDRAKAHPKSMLNLIGEIAPGKPVQHERSAKEQAVFDALLRTSPDAWGKRDRQGGRKIRLGDMVEPRLANFLEANPQIELTHFVNCAVHRLLKDLGE